VATVLGAGIAVAATAIPERMAPIAAPPVVRPFARVPLATRSARETDDGLTHGTTAVDALTL